MRERLSVFLDGELGHAESLKLIKQLDSDLELRGCWQRYHLYGSALRDELTPVLSADFSQRVSDVLANEPVQFAPAKMTKKRRIVGPVAGFAVAASLVGIAILLQKPAIQNTEDTPVPSVAEVTIPLSLIEKSAETSPESTLIVSNSKNENIRERINQLLVEHNEYNPASDMTGLMPYARFVGYKPQTERSE